MSGFEDVTTLKYLVIAVLLPVEAEQRKWL